MASDGTLDVPAIAARYQLSATRLLETTLDELRAVNLPAILELNDRSGPRSYLLRRLEGAGAILISPSGGEMRRTIDDLDASWTHAAWVMWRNVDNLPVDPNQELTPIVIATLALRLQKLGLLSPPLPATNSERLQQAVRRFQASVGLTVDGIAGPRTTLALARVVAGRFSPNLAGGSAPSR
jgi:general secretion pathway protein A